MPRDFFVYVLTNKSRFTLYIGMTNDLQSRLWQHRNPEERSFTQTYHCILLVYFETYPDALSAIAREKQLKGWRRARKNALVESVNPLWRDLSPALFG